MAASSLSSCLCEPALGVSNSYHIGDHRHGRRCCNPVPNAHAVHHQTECWARYDSVEARLFGGERKARSRDSIVPDHRNLLQSTLFRPPPSRSLGFGHPKRVLDRRKRIRIRGAHDGDGEVEDTSKDKQWWNPFGLFRGQESPASRQDSSLDLDGEAPAPSSKMPQDAKTSYQPLGTRNGQGAGAKKDTKVGDYEQLIVNGGTNVLTISGCKTFCVLKQSACCGCVFLCLPSSVCPSYQLYFQPSADVVVVPLRPFY